MDRQVFFDAVRASIYGGQLAAPTVKNIEIIFDYWDDHYAGNPLNQLAYVLATVLAEVGRNMTPVRESFAVSDAQARQRLSHKAYGKSTPPFGHAYYGRGYVQLTWRKNYEAQGKRMNKPFVEFPDMVLETANAIDILFIGMYSGAFNGQGKGLAFYVNATKQDFVSARRTVNVQDKAQQIADNATKFLDALREAGA